MPASVKGVQQPKILFLFRQTMQNKQFTDVPFGKGFFCACSLIFTTSRGVTKKGTNKAQNLSYVIVNLKRQRCKCTLLKTN